MILCCGAIESPKLLLLSGIGDPAHLRKVGIPLTVELPGVGQNFHDHPLVIGPIGRMSRPGPDPRGNMTEVGLFWRSHARLAATDLEICFVHRAPFGEAFFENVTKRFQTGKPVPLSASALDPHIVLSIPGLIRPLSRGWVRLRDSDPASPPAVNPDYGAEPDDLSRIVQMVKIARDIYRTRSFAAWGLEEVSPGPTIDDDTKLRNWVINNLGSYYHFAGSCKMGVDRLAVVDPELKVHGIEGFRRCGRFSYAHRAFRQPAHHDRHDRRARGGLHQGQPISRVQEAGLGNESESSTGDLRNLSRAVCHRQAAHDRFQVETTGLSAPRLSLGTPIGPRSPSTATISSAATCAAS